MAEAVDAQERGTKELKRTVISGQATSKLFMTFNGFLLHDQ